MADIIKDLQENQELLPMGRYGGLGMSRINAIEPALEKQLDDLIKNADKEEDKERFKALKVLAKYHETSQIRTSFNPYADGRYDLTIDLIGCCRRY